MPELETAVNAAGRPDAGPLARVPSGGLVLGAIASVQFGSAIATHLFDTVGPAGAVLLRLLTAAVVLCAVWRPAFRHRTRRDLLLACVFGTTLAAMNLSFYAALHRIPLGIAVTIEFIGPLAVALSGSRRALDFAWVALAGVGILALARGGVHHLDGLGVLFAVLAGGCWAAYILINARVGRAFEGGTGLALAMVVATVVAFPVGVIQGGSQLLSVHVLLIGTAVGMLSSAIPYSLELEALRRISAPVFGVLMSLEPAMAALAGFLVLDQNLSPRALVGIALVVIASIGASRRSREAPVAL